MKVALAHDDFCQVGGAESLFATIAQLYPNAPIYTSLVNWKKLPQSISRDRIKTSFIQKIPFASRFYKLLLPLYPLAFESFDFTNFDLVISSTTRFAKSIITTPNTIHICYVNSTPRFLWSQKAAAEYLPKIIRVLLKPLFSHLKRWDKVASSRVDFYIANSKNVQSQIKEIYSQDSEVIYPFADLDFFTLAKVHNWQLKSQEYFLVVTRLVKWKKVEIAIDAVNDLSLKLKIVGTGPDEARLKKLSNSKNVQFIGKVSSQYLRELYQNARALILTQEEDFGIAVVEAQACGIPALAYSGGGPSEIITKKTGFLFENQTQKSLQDAITQALEVKWSQSACRKNSQRFSQANFVKGLKDLIKLYGPKS